MNNKITFTASMLYLVSTTTFAQTLNDVVADQLAFDGSACAKLLENGSASQLTGELQTLCLRNSPAGSTPASNAGGGAATPGSLPKIVKQRLKNDQTDASGSTTSSDQVLNITPAISLFLSGDYQSLDRNVTTFEDGYDSDIWRIIAGTDFRIQDMLVIGIAFDYHHQKGDYTGSGDFKLNSYGGLVFANITPTDNLFIQLSGSYSAQENDRHRLTSFNEASSSTSVSGFVDSQYDADQYSANIQSGYDFNFANVTFGPRVGFSWSRNNFDSYTESGNTGLELSFDENHRTSLQSRLGLFSSLAFSTSFGVIVPQFGVDWVHEFEDDQREIHFSFANDLRNKSLTFQNESPDRDFFEIQAGTSIVMANNVQTYVNYTAITGHNYFDSHSLNFGLRVAF